MFPAGFNPSLHVHQFSNVHFVSLRQHFGVIQYSSLVQTSRQRLKRDEKCWHLPFLHALADQTELAVLVKGARFEQ